MSNRGFKFVGDRELSTYRHAIILKPEYRIGNVLDLEGYNKHKNHAEPVDKVKAFVDYVSRIVTGNLYKATVIEFYTNSRTGKVNDERLLYITSGSYEIGPRFNHIQPLIDFCERVKANGGIKPEDKPKKVVSTKTDWDSYFKYGKGIYKNLQELQTYCRLLVNSGVPQGRVEGYFFDVKAKYDL
ncbi:hypothetical protein [Flectobacillus roseus]|uniref:hypothetical protein n=1 Tax=Flectobacillus roseus TaxID=502259 RepID=UPI0024B6F2EE|nr:hypothetical protein [Flectobacillus roseus]MDI9870606.1 hypothetical protein [Flectobacillus roseus]